MPGNSRRPSVPPRWPIARPMATSRRRSIRSRREQRMRKMPRTYERGAHRTDPDYAPSVEIFDNLSHQEIHEGVQQLNPAVLSEGQQAWQGSATGLADAVEQAHTEIRSAIADGWR